MIISIILFLSDQPPLSVRLKEIYQQPINFKLSKYGESELTKRLNLIIHAFEDFGTENHFRGAVI